MSLLAICHTIYAICPTVKICMAMYTSASPTATLLVNPTSAGF